MIFRVLALVFVGAAIVTGFSLGWGTELGVALQRMNARAMTALQSAVEGYLLPELWQGIFLPVFSIPAWTAWVALAAIAYVASAVQPGKT